MCVRPSGGCCRAGRSEKSPRTATLAFVTAAQVCSLRFDGRPDTGPYRACAELDIIWPRWLITFSTRYHHGIPGIHDVRRRNGCRTSCDTINNYLACVAYDRETYLICYSTDRSVSRSVRLFITST